MRMLMAVAMAVAVAVMTVACGDNPVGPGKDLGVEKVLVGKAPADGVAKDHVKKVPPCSPDGGRVCKG